MFEVGMEVVRVYPQLGKDNYIAEGEITSVHEDADDVTLVSVMYNDGAMKVYTEDAMKNELGRRMLVTTGEKGRLLLQAALERGVGIMDIAQLQEQHKFFTDMLKYYRKDKKENARQWICQDEV